MPKCENCGDEKYVIHPDGLCDTCSEDYGFCECCGEEYPADELRHDLCPWCQPQEIDVCEIAHAWQELQMV